MQVEHQISTPLASVSSSSTSLSTLSTSVSKSEKQTAPVIILDSDDDIEIPDPFPFPKTFGTNVDVALLSSMHVNVKLIVIVPFLNFFRENDTLDSCKILHQNLLCNGHVQEIPKAGRL